jgi:hypothetical protein
MNNPDFTSQQSSFISALVLEGCNPTEAARRAGYAHPKQRAHELLQKQHILAEIKREQSRALTGNLSNIALGTLQNVMENQKNPASARVAAARAVLEAAGHFKAPERTTDINAPHLMTRTQLEAIITKIEGEYAAH